MTQNRPSSCPIHPGLLLFRKNGVGNSSYKTGQSVPPLLTRRHTPALWRFVLAWSSVFPGRMLEKGCTRTARSLSRSHLPSWLHARQTENHLGLHLMTGGVERRRVGGCSDSLWRDREGVPDGRSMAPCQKGGDDRAMRVCGGSLPCGGIGRIVG